MMGYGWGMGAAGWIAMAVFWLSLIGLIGWAVARAFPAGGSREGEVRRYETPEEVLDRRYAAGELDTETYESMRARLGSARSARGERR